jgi:hypothetical protein
MNQVEQQSADDRQKKLLEKVKQYEQENPPVKRPLRK